MSDSSRPPPSGGLRETDAVQYDSAHPEGSKRRDSLIVEGPLTVDVDGSTYTLLRTPGSDRELVVGFLFSEGLIARVADILLLSECPGSADVINVRTSVAGEKPRRTMVITSSCGLCGMQDIDGMVATLGRVESTIRVPVTSVYRVPAKVREMQPLFSKTGAAHAAAWFDTSGNVVCVREDVGRHNAFDKLIGHGLLRGVDLGGMCLFLSGRTSLELVVKAARSRIPVVAAVGAPTSVAVEAADRLGITLCGFLREERLTVYTHGWRMDGSV